MRVAVVGAGHVGLVTGLALWERGHAVVFVDNDAARVAKLARAQAPFFEPGVSELLARAISAGHVEVQGEMDAVRDCDAALVCVPTPSGDGGVVDTRYLASASSAIASAMATPSASTRLRTVFVRSTVVPGTTRRVFVEALARSVDVGVLPEFLREGSALDDARQPDRIVVGADKPRVYAAARALYGDTAPLVETTLETAELVKYANNAMLALCVSFSNELARIAEHLPGVDARDVLAAVVRDRRLSIDGKRAGIASYLEPGPGFGGSCLGKDVRALAALARAQGETTALLDGILAINRAQPVRFVERIERAMGGLRGRSVLVLGLAFKAHTDDVRESIASPVVAELEARGARVTCHDPAAAASFFAGRNGPAEMATDWRAAAKEADALLLLSAWPEYTADLPALLSKKARPLLLADARGVLRDCALPRCVRYLGIGRAESEES